MRSIRVEEGIFGKREIIYFNIIQVIVNAIGWFLIAPALGVLIYAEPANKEFTQGLFAGISNIITVAILGTILIATYAKTRSKSGSLYAE